jgi:hypothetical protein
MPAFATKANGLEAAFCEKPESYSPDNLKFFLSSNGGLDRRGGLGSAKDAGRRARARTPSGILSGFKDM